ncbi:unnamed protein product [Allacma fusca]|uniref:Uncharacterized protein n=1 Tax=Allacma fusca TaxID=39272 RepID=A0A8J2LIG0_9HEXA|nr:unnamed protein product [Allacma fusca]
MSRLSSAHDQAEKYEVQIPKPSSALVTGGICTYIGGIFLLFAFASPYWLVSWQYTFSPFKRMGLWEFCFDKYRHPHFQYDKLFSGCHYIFSDYFMIIREWILPGWLMTVQAFFTLAFMASFGVQAILALLVTRWPLKIVMRNEGLLILISCGGNAAASFLIFLSVSIFGGQCYRRDWLPYPNFNYLSWAFAFAIISMFIHGLAALILYGEYQAAKIRRHEEDHLVMSTRHHHGAASGMSNPSSESHHYV